MTKFLNYTMGIGFISLMMCILACLLILPVSAGVVTLEEYNFNVKCEDLGCGGNAFKIEDTEWGGTHPIESIGSVTIRMINNTHFDFTASGISIHAVIVKGGKGANVYNYSCSSYGSTVTSDTDLGTRLNPSSGKYYDISHIEFCYDTTPPPVPEFPPSVVPVLVIISIFAYAGILVLSLVRNQ